MDEIAATGPKSHVSALSTKVSASIEGVQEGLKDHSIEGTDQLSQTQSAKEFEITMEEADRAFALMTEIREKIEGAYQKLSESE